MADRVPNLLRTVAALTAGLFLLTSALTAQPPAAPAAKPAPPVVAVPTLDQPVATPDEMKAKQEEIKKNFTQFKETLFRLATRLEKSDRVEAKDQAKVIRTALEIAEKQGVDGQFSKLVAGIAGAKNSLDFDKLSAEDKQLVQMLKSIMTILETDDETARLREEAKKLEAFIKELKAIKASQESVQARTEAKTGNKDRLADQQKDLKEQTQDVANRLGGKDNKDGKGGDANKKDDRADAKADPKAGEQAGEKKNDTGEAKGDAKEGKEGSASEGKGGEPKDGAGESKGGEPKDPKESDKAGEGKGGDQEPKASDAKPGDGKPSDSKGSAGKGQGEGKGEGKPSQGEGGEGKGSGQPGQAPPPQGGSKGGGQPGQPGGQQPPQPPSNQMPGRKEVAEAVPQQQQAQDKIQQDKRSEAGKNQDNAIDKLAKAIAELEKRLKQLREEEMKKLLANVEARCSKMLMMQIEVYENTKRIDENVTKNGGQKNPADIQKSQGQSDKEGEIVAEAERCLKLLESEGSAVSFAMVLSEVRQDMIAVQRRLGSAIVDKDTQAIEENIIAMLKDMIEALKKAQAELGKPQEPKPPSNGKPPNQKLISLLAELKLIRSMQQQVNMRTKMHGDKEKAAEQAKDPLIKAELQQLSSRQQKLEEMIEKLANGENQ